MNPCPMKCGPASVCAKAGRCLRAEMERRNGASSPRPARLATAARVPLEHDEQAALFTWAEKAKAQLPELAELFAVPNSGGYKGGFKSNIGIAQRAKREGVKAGVEDVMLLVARGGYHGLLIEMKRVNATPSDVKPEQREWHKIHIKRGFMVEVCKGAEEAKAVLISYLSMPVTKVVHR